MRVLQLVREMCVKGIHSTKRDLFYADVKLFEKQVLSCLSYIFHVFPCLPMSFRCIYCGAMLFVSSVYDTQGHVRSAFFEEVPPFSVIRYTSNDV